MGLWSHSPPLQHESRLVNILVQVKGTRRRFSCLQIATKDLNDKCSICLEKILAGQNICHFKYAEEAPSYVKKLVNILVQIRATRQKRHSRISSK